MRENRLSCTDYMQPGFQSRTAVFAPTKLVKPRGCAQVLRYGMQGLHRQHLSHSALQTGCTEHGERRERSHGRTNLPGSHPEIRNNLTPPLDQAHRSLSELV